MVTGFAGACVCLTAYLPNGEFGWIYHPGLLKARPLFDTH